MYKTLSSWPNLLLAWQRAAKGKRGHASVAAFEHHLEDNLLQLQQDLLTFTYRPGTYASFHIHEPKRRLISAAPFRDRVVHHALCNLIEPLFERRFHPASYANRVGKGTHRALKHAQRLARQYPFVLQCDIRQFFPSIDHELLFNRLEDRILDSRVLWLCQKILDSGRGVLAQEYEMQYFPGDDLFAVQRPRGLPIGNLTSQFWANVYLNGLDHFVSRRLRPGGYLRYVDDFLLFGKDKPTLWKCLQEIENYLSGLRLGLHPGARPVPVGQGIPFLGFRVFPQKRRLKRQKGLYFQRKLRQLARAYAAGRLPIETLTASVQGWVNHLRYGNTVGLRKSVLGNQRISRREG